jgi:hypothetical protein
VPITEHDEAARWVRASFPEDDYLPLPEPPSPRWQVRGTLEDDEGTGPEAGLIAELFAKPEQRRSRLKEPRDGHMERVLVRNARCTWTKDDLPEVVAPPAGRRPTQGGCVPLAPVPAVLGEFVTWELIHEDDGPYDRYFSFPGSVLNDDWYDEDVDDEYASLAHYYGVRWDIDDRPQWQRELGIDDAELEMDETASAGEGYSWEDDDPAHGNFGLDANCEEEPLLAPGPVCGNPHGCDGQVKAKARCAACLEFRRTHHGQERPKRLIQRAWHRDHGC